MISHPVLIQYRILLKGVRQGKSIAVVYTLVDFKSHYNKTKISEMDISNIYLKKTKGLKYLHKTGSKLVG